MKFDENHTLNEKIVTHKKKPGVPAIGLPESHPDPYMRLGSHPEIVQRIWDDFGETLPEDCRAIIYGTPALVEPISGVVFAMSYGTAYAIRVPTQLIDMAYKAGCKAEKAWTGGGKTIIEEALGYGWVFGAWLDAESQWVIDVYNELKNR